MMPILSKRSLGILATCDSRLQAVCNEAIKYFDFAVICGHRCKEDQDAAVAAGNSKTPWPTSKHNLSPSKAVDIAPYPIDWDNRERFVLLAQVMLRTAAKMGIKLRWGGDFNRDGNYTNDKFVDLPHFEIDE